MKQQFLFDDVWINKKIYDDAEIVYYENLAKASVTPLAVEVAKVRQKLIESRDTFTSTNNNVNGDVENLTEKIKGLESKIFEMEKTINYILNQMKKTPQCKHSK